LNIRLTKHAKNKIAVELLKFGVDELVVFNTIKNPDETLYDTKTGRYVAVNYEKKIAIIYEKNSEILIITIIYSSIIDKLVTRRKRSNRWV